MALALSLPFTAHAHAQILSAYVTSTNARVANVQTGTVASTPSGTFTNQYTSLFTSGIGGGVTFNFIPTGPVRVGFDVRGSTKPGTSGVDTALAGLRLGFKAPLIGLKPFVQASAGYLATRTANVSTVQTTGTTTTAVGGTFTNKYIAYQFLGGVDYRIFPFVDFRILEFGIGKGYNTGISFSSSNPSVTLLDINTGLVIHF